MTGWWQVVTGGCFALCALSPQTRGCGEPDCEKLEFHEYRPDGAHSYLWTSHSPAARSFTLILIVPEDTWELPAPCELQSGDGGAVPFTCGDDQLLFSSRVYNRPSVELETAIEDARAQGQGEYLY